MVQLAWNANKHDRNQDFVVGKIVKFITIRLAFDPLFRFPKVTWRRTVEVKELKECWNTLQKTAKDRLGGRTLVAGLHAQGVTGSK